MGVLGTPLDGLSADPGKQELLGIVILWTAAHSLLVENRSDVETVCMSAPYNPPQEAPTWKGDSSGRKFGSQSTWAV